MLKTPFFKSLVKPLNFILCGLAIAALIWHFSRNRMVSLHYLDQQGITHTLQLPKKDRESLAGLMRQLFLEDNFAYTLLGSKPVSWATYQNLLPMSNWEHFWDSFSEYSRGLRSGWKTWEKYRHLFPSAPFWSECSNHDLRYSSIFIINADRFNEVVNNHKRDFQEVLNREIEDGFQLIREAKNHTLYDVLGGHQALIGIVLGYGRDNSWKFLESCEIRKPYGWVWDEKSYFGEEDYDFDKFPLSYYLLWQFSCPSFAGDPHSEESKVLKTDYLLTKQKVLAYYKDKDLLEASLSLLAGFRPQE